MPHVSFILPAYKRRFLKAAIESILSQTFRDFELVVVDDASPENLKEIVDEFHDSRLSYFRNDANIGGKNLVAAWNVAMEHAKGEWCVLASDDDVYSPRFLEVMLGLLEKHQKCDLAHARIGYVDAEGRFLRPGEQRIEFETQVQFVYSKGVARFSQCAPDFIFRRSALVEAGGFVEFPLAWFSDDATWMKLAKNGVCCSSEMLFFCRLSGESITTKPGYLEKKIEAAEMFRDWFRAFAPSLSPQTEEDRALADGIVRKAEARLDRFIGGELDSAGSIFHWAKLAAKTRLSRVDKLRYAASWFAEQVKSLGRLVLR